MHLIVAQNVGWDITYIGNGVPHDEITYTATNVRAQLVVLAINNQEILLERYMKLNIFVKMQIGQKILFLLVHNVTIISN